jgi:hypothetical protein
MREDEVFFDHPNITSLFPPPFFLLPLLYYSTSSVPQLWRKILGMMEMTRYTMRLGYGRCWWTPARKPVSISQSRAGQRSSSSCYGMRASAAAPLGDQRRGHKESVKSAEDIEMRGGSDIIYLLREANWRD